MDEKVAIIVFNVLNTMSMVMSLVVLIFLLRVSKWNSYLSVLLANFHVSIIFEGIVAIPYVYRSSQDLCIFIEVVRMYMDLWNICIVFALIVCHCGSILGMYARVVKTRKHLRNWIYVYPLVMCLLPFAANDYSYDNENPWCSIQHRAFSWPVILCYMLVWVGLLASLIIFSITFYRLWKSADADKLMHIFCNTVGMYALGGFFLWVPRSIVLFARKENQLTFGNHFFSNLPIGVEGIIFFAIFFFQERTAVLTFETDLVQGDADSTFTWERDEVFRLFSEPSVSVSSYNNYEFRTSRQNPFLEKFVTVNTSRSVDRK